MGYTREQINQIFRAKYQTFLTKTEKDKQDKLQKEADAKKKQQEFWGTLNAAGVAANLGKSARNFIVEQMRDVRYGEDLNLGGKPVPQRKWDFKTKTERDWLPEGLLPGGKEAKLGKVGGAIKDYLLPLEKTEGYKEFKRKEFLESPEFAEEKEVFKEGALSWQKEEMATKEREAQEAADIQAETMKQEELGEVSGFLEEQEMKKLEIENIENAKFNQYGLTKSRATELSDILEREGVMIPAGMTEEKTLELLSSFDKVPMGSQPVGSEQKEYRAFVDTLKSGSQNPNTFQSVVTDLTANTDATIQSVIEGTYAPEVEDVSTVVDITDPSAYPDIEEWEKDLGIGEEVFTAEELKNLPASSQQAVLPTEAPEGLGQYGMTPAQKAIQELERKTMPSGVSMQELERDLPAKPLSFAEQTLPATLTEEPTGLGRTMKLRDSWDPLGDEPMPGITPTEGMPEGVPYASGAEGAPIIPDVEAPVSPDMEAPSVDPGSLIGKGFEAGQTALQVANIGKTLTSEDATDEQKTVASVQGAKMLADIAAKNLKKEGAKAVGKTVGSAASGVLGAYTAVTEGKEMVESFEEKDYDEAILHGVNAASGAAQTAGLGMMATGIGAPLGAIMYGVGKAGQVVSSVGLFLEGLFGGKTEAPAPQKPKFDISNYLDRMRFSRRR